MPLNFDLAGKVYDPAEVTISGEEIEEYARASGDLNPRYAVGEGQIASPIFLVVPSLPLMEAVPADPDLNVENMLMLVHGEQQFTYHRPLLPGATVVLTPSLLSVEDKGRGATYTVGVTAATTDGEPLVDMSATVFVRGGGSGEKRVQAVPAAAPEKGEITAVFDRHVPDDMPVRYAAISGDHNPIHLDDDVARSVGLPGRINHGLATLSLVTGGLLEQLAGDDPARLGSLRVRFTDMVFPGSDVSTTVWSAGERSFLFETKRSDGVVVISGGLDLVDG